MVQSLSRKEYLKNYKEKRKDFFNSLSDKEIEELKTKNCKIHGQLTKDQIVIIKPYGYVTCKICKSNWQQKSRYAIHAWLEHECVKCKIIKSKNDFTEYDRKLNYPYCYECRIKFPTNHKIKQKHYLKIRYSLTPDKYYDMLNNQNGLCAICKKPEKIKKKKSKTTMNLSIDHCHKTNMIRSLLCGNCNKLIGLAYESAYILRNAALYLEKWNG